MHLELGVSSSRPSTQPGSGSAGAPGSPQQRAAKPCLVFLHSVGPGSPFPQGRVYTCPSSQDGVPPSSCGLSDRGDAVMLHLSVQSQVPECGSHAEPRVRADVWGELAETRLSPRRLFFLCSLSQSVRHGKSETLDRRPRGGVWSPPRAAQGSEVQPCSAGGVAGFPACVRTPWPATARPGPLGSESPLAGPQFSLPKLHVSASENPSRQGLLCFPVAVGAVLGDSKVASRP